MFSSYVFFHLVDLVLAALAVCLVLRVFPRRWSEGARRRWPELLATPFRRLWLLEAPTCLLIGLALVPVCEHWIFAPLGRALASVGVPAILSPFLPIGVAYYALFLVLPIVGIRRAFRVPLEPLPAGPQDGDPGRLAVRRRADRGLAVLAALVAGGTCATASGIEPNRLVVERPVLALSGWPADRPALRIVILADVQTPMLTERVRGLPERVAALQPDLILIPGDLVAQSLDESLPLEAGRFLAAELHAPLGVFAVNGDVDQFVAGGLRRVLEGSEVRLLDNERVVLDTDPPVELAGFDPTRPGYQALLESPPRADVRLSMVHRPDHAFDLQAAGFDLVVAGHTHGGQVVLPLMGPPITLSTIPRRMAAGGLHRIGDETWLYVSRGVGVEAGFAPPLRFLCPPELTLLTLGPRRDGEDQTLQASLGGTP